MGKMVPVYRENFKLPLLPFSKRDPLYGVPRGKRREGASLSEQVGEGQGETGEEGCREYRRGLLNRELLWSIITTFM